MPTYHSTVEETYQSILEKGPIQGCNFWSWGGEGIPSSPGGFWSSKDDLIGDPPHERQGWYSVYENDTSTISIIKRAAHKINGIKE